MKDKNEYVNKLINECLKIIVNNKIKMSDLAFEMGINLIDLYMDDGLEKDNALTKIAEAVFWVTYGEEENE